jgi:serine/threonine protein kinase
MIQDINKLGEDSEKSASVNLKDFTVIERLGKGSFGSVYLTEKKSNVMIYAMKVLEKDKVLKQNLVRYAMTERNVLSLAKHPFIVSLNYAFQTS